MTRERHKESEPVAYEISVVFRENASSDKIEIQISAPERCPQVEELLTRLAAKERFIDVPSDGGRIIRLRTDSIIRIYSQNRKNYVCWANETFRTSASINELYGQLCGDSFLRISRFEIINLSKAVYFDFSIAGELKIKLENDQTVFASRRYIPVIRNYLKGGEKQ